MREIPDWQLALDALSEVYEISASERGRTMAAGWLEDRYGRYGWNATSPSANAYGTVVEDLKGAEAIFITREMQELTYEAMETFNRDEPLHFDDIFIPHGFALLETPFYSQDSQGKQMAWRAISWRYYPGVLVQEKDSESGIATSEPKEEPVVKIFLWSHLDDDDDYTTDYGEMRESLRRKGLTWGVAHCTALPLRFAHLRDKLAQDGDPLAAWLTFFRVLQRLMAEKITVKSKRQANRAFWRTAKRRGIDIREIVVVELRRAKHPSAKNGEHAKYSHRFLRRGHWRNQWHSSIRMHRQRWISTTIVGDENLPLVIKKRVWVWDR